MGRKLSPLAVLSLLLLIALCACRSPTDPSLPDLVPGEWNRFAGSASTVCADGSDFSYYASAGTTNRLIIDFQGGGACWDGASCTSPFSDPDPEVGAGLYRSQVETSQLEEGAAAGIYDRNDPANPLRDWYHVFIPYCTGDVHVGDVTQTYADPVDETSYTVEHRGAANARDALDWIFANFGSPESVLVTGCSAGGYGATFWSGTIAERYPGARIFHLSDSAAGVASDDWVSRWEQSWHVTATFPDLTMDANVLADVYIDRLATHGNLSMSQYNTVADAVQAAFLALGAGEPAEAWTERMLASLGRIASASEDFVSYVSGADDDDHLANGTQHCIITRDEFYSVEVQGRAFRDWVDDYVQGRPVRSLTTPLPEPARADPLTAAGQED